MKHNGRGTRTGSGPSPNTLACSASHVRGVTHHDTAVAGIGNGQPFGGCLL